MSYNRSRKIATDAAPLSAEKITEYLPDELKGFKIIALESAGSTNVVARELAAETSGEFAVIAASQTAGRGTKGRAFYSPNGSGLYMSALLRPSASAEYAPLLTPAVAVAVCGAAEELGSAPLKIKWVNDILLGGKKICGILTEAAFRGDRLDFAIVGMGVNLAPPLGGFSKELASVAGALFDKPPLFAREKLAAGIIARLAPMSRALSEADFVEEYRRRSAVIGERISVISPRGERAATAIGIDGRCRLLARYDDGAEEALAAGEISVRLGDK